MAIALLTLALVGTLSLAATIGIGYGVPLGAAAMKTHFLAALGATTLLVMAHSFIMFFLIATGVELKDMEKAHGWGDSFRRRTSGSRPTTVSWWAPGRSGASPRRAGNGTGRGGATPRRP